MTGVPVMNKQSIAVLGLVLTKVFFSPLLSPGSWSAIVGEWHDPRGNHPQIVPFTQPSRFVSEKLHIESDIPIGTSYLLFLPDELFKKIAEQIYMQHRN